ncbi:coiled-coil domain-containing protein 130 isoform X1 [Felis catus]|uniref:coiled-coil domain-containing protein 130 isoform X1 n=1 Tax=Felis catus TaxID=9685 RepID=UPI001D19C386|nr:coiled-coil domain-containing protein 130 isoform X1 [Felis catus]XP_044902592.1 coiled-coil domain-containing protein 130 isoform X1 [Felis catus]XP_044902593.1 coiled-coil domain-containing protein 130 isoform X1 [Felis catus]XP_044902595.1 coiled-coil domain-containing protein 130 isoform X1 [Felis catus]XP_044902600.1 coiled-coil domain-containing protein 130 isoform X1 [Felis catus]XP_044902610.1 coiled-coil domain-containing protein 130 isoform X1 [Felis catus]
MGERKGVNKYYPPDFNPEKHGSLNRYHNSHPLRERARKLSQGILIIRFEMPYNIWCDGCKNHIGMGVRYNAEKKKVGNYYTTPIYRHPQGSLSFLGFLLQHHLSERPLPEQHSPPNTGCLCICCERGPCWDVSPSKSRLTSFTAVSSAAAAKPAAGQPRSGGFVECTKEQTPDRRSALGRWDGVCLTHSRDPRHRAWFRMKCHLCVNYIEMQTDPANCDYVIVSGAQRKEERWDMEDNEQVLTTEHEKKQKLETDAMFRLEHGEADRSTLKKALPTLSHIQEAQSAWKDDFALNSMLRKRFREKKKAMQEEEERDQALQAKASLAIPLVPETEDDRKLAALLKFHTLDSYEDKQKLKRTEIISRSWFSSTPGPRTGSSKAGSVLKKLAQNRRCAPVGSPITVEDLGIVRRRSREALENLRLAAETPKPGEPWVPEGNTQDRPASPPDGSPETAETPRSRGPPGQAGKRQDRPRSPPGPSQEAAASQDTPHPGTLSSSLVADYSDSESE